MPSEFLSCSLKYANTRSHQSAHSSGVKRPSFATTSRTHSANESHQRRDRFHIRRNARMRSSRRRTSTTGLAKKSSDSPRESVRAQMYRPAFSEKLKQMWNTISRSLPETEYSPICAPTPGSTANGSNSTEAPLTTARSSGVSALAVLATFGAIAAPGLAIACSGVTGLITSPTASGPGFSRAWAGSTTPRSGLPRIELYTELAKALTSCGRRTALGPWFGGESPKKSGHSTLIIGIIPVPSDDGDRHGAAPLPDAPCPFKLTNGVRRLKKAEFDVDCDEAKGDTT
mmetsp:Transcript_15700/g.38878  ORF Transcript_15700/g.38878 Transcript_15700/m.38878 type:complete len:286 (+) Transcript_15700:623-1480(+)